MQLPHAHLAKGSSRDAALLLGVPLFFAIFGAKLLTLHLYGSDLPYWDQWPGEGVNTLLPWLERQEFWRHLLTLHNEHRIVPTRLLSLSLLAFGGQWDARVQCVANAGIHAGMIVAALFWLRSKVTPGWLCIIAVCCAALYAPPLAWENVLGGFQSQYYFLIALSLFGIGGCLTFRVRSAGWVCAAGSCFLAVVTMGSGMLAAFPIAVVSLLRLLRREESRAAYINLMLALMVGALGAYLYVPAAHHDHLHAHTPLQFLGYAARCLSWPWPHWPWLWIVIWAPWLVLCFTRITTTRARGDNTWDVLIATGLWVLAQTAALSHTRGAGSLLPSIRYGEVTGLGVPLGLAVIAVLAPRFGAAWRSLGVLYALAVCAASGLAARAAISNDLPRVKREALVYERNVQEFILTDDETALKENFIPFPWPHWLRDLLRNPYIRVILPASVKSPVQVPGFANATWVEEPHRRIRHVPGNSKWDSAPIIPDGGWWRIEVSSGTSSQSSLQLRSAASGSVLQTMELPGKGSNAWRTLYVPAPKEHSYFAVTASADGPLMFTEPIEVSNLSYQVLQVCKRGAVIMYAGGAALAFGIFHVWWSCRHRQRSLETVSGPVMNPLAGSLDADR